MNDSQINRLVSRDLSFLSVCFSAFGGFNFASSGSIGGTIVCSIIFLVGTLLWISLGIAFESSRFAGEVPVNRWGLATSFFKNRINFVMGLCK